MPMIIKDITEFEAVNIIFEAFLDYVKTDPDMMDTKSFIMKVFGGNCDINRQISRVVIGKIKTIYYLMVYFRMG